VGLLPSIDRSAGARALGYTLGAAALLLGLGMAAAGAAADQPPKRVIVPLGTAEDLPVAVTTVQLVGELPAGVGVPEVSALLQEPRSITRMSGLRELALRIEQLVQAKGYPFFYVLLPDQEIFNGRVRLLAVNGKIDRVVQIEGANRRVSDDRLQDYFRDLIQSGGFKRADFERTMLMINELPATNARLILGPGSAPGLIDAKLNVDQGPLMRWSVNFNNHGAESTGRERLTTNLKLNDISGIGDRLSVTVSKTSRDLTAGVLEYRVPLGISGLSAQVTALRSGFGVDAGLNSLGIKGNTRSNEIALSYPLVLRFDRRLTIEGSSIRRSSENEIEMLDPMRKSIQVQRLGLRGSTSDPWGGTTSARLVLSSGQVSPLAGYFDLSPRSFRLLTFDVSRSQSLTPTTTLQLSVSGQRTTDILDGSEQMSFGGASAVRGYGGATLFADQGNLYRAELTHILSPDLAGLGRLRAFVFYDRGVAFLDPVVGARNTIAGAGLGVSLMRWTFYEVRGTYAQRLGSAQNVGVPDDRIRGGQFWLNVLAFF